MQETLFAGGQVQFLAGLTGSDDRATAIAYEDSGPSVAGPHVFVCVHGIGDSRLSFRLLAPKLLTRGRVIAVDMRGCGESGAKFGSYTPEDVADDIHRLLVKLAIAAPVVVLGNSFAACSAVRLASEHPAKIAGLVLLGGIVRDLPADKYFRPVSHLLFNRFWGTGPWVGHYKDNLFGDFKPADFDDYVHYVRKMMAGGDRTGALGAMARATKANVYSRAAEVKAPILNIIGAKDPDFDSPAKELETLKDGFANAAKYTPLLMDGVGHYPHVEKPDEVFAAIVEFLA